MSTHNGTNGHRGINWPTLFAGIGLLLTIGVIVVNSLVGQWSVQFKAVHDKITAEREVTDLKLKNERAYFDAELAKAQKEAVKHTGK